jgi:hypothetical protein
VRQCLGAQSSLPLDVVSPLSHAISLVGVVRSFLRSRLVFCLQTPPARVCLCARAPYVASFSGWCAWRRCALVRPPRRCRRSCCGCDGRLTH